MNVKKHYSGLSIYGDKIVADQSIVGEKLTKLEPGIYTPHFDFHHNLFWFETFNPVSDDIIELESPEYKQVTEEMAYFLRSQTKKDFKDLGYIYKRSALLHGLPGTGKTCIVNRIAKNVVTSGGIVIYCQYPDILEKAFQVIDDLQPDTTVMVVFEEFDDIAHKYEKRLLNLLDGQVQKQNVIYLATTNYLDKIPKRLYRPGRFSSVIEVNFPVANARKQYLIHKLGRDFNDLELFVERTNGFSIDELKEVIQSVVILQNNLESTLERIKSTRDFSEPVKDNPFATLEKTIMPLLKGPYNPEDQDIFDDESHEA